MQGINNYPNTLYTLYISECNVFTVYTIHYTLYNVHYTLYNAHYTYLDTLLITM